MNRTGELNPIAKKPGGFAVFSVRPNLGFAAAFSSKIFIAALMAGVLALSAFALSRQSLRLDEAQSLWQSSRSPAGILYVLAQDVHVPLYPLLLHFWQFFFGNEVSQVRLFSLVFFLFSIPLTFLLGKLAYNRSVGLFAAALMAFSPFLNWYGNEIRMYSLLTFLTLANQYFLLKLYKISERADSPQAPAGLWAGYAATAFLGIFTHYFFWLILAAQVLFLLIYRRSAPRFPLKRMFAIWGMLAAAISPWVYYVARIGMLSNAEPILTNPTSINLFNTFSQFLFGFQTDHLNSLIISLWPLSVLFAFLALKKNNRLQSQTVFLLVSVLVPIILAFAVSLIYRPLFLTRYLIFTAPFLYLFISWFLSAYPKRLGTPLKALTIAIMLVTMVSQIRGASTPVKENYREASSYLSQHASEQDVVIISAPFTIYPIEYYYRGQASLATLPVWNRFVTGAIPEFNSADLPGQAGEINGSHQKAYLLLSYDQGYEENIRYYYDTHFHRLEEKNFSPGLNLYVYKLRYDSVSFDHLINTSKP